MVKIFLQNLKDMISSSQFLTRYAGEVFDMGMLSKHVDVVFKVQNALRIRSSQAPIFEFLFV